MTDFTDDTMLNRGARRLFDKTNPSCRKCGIRWKDRFEQWSFCTVNRPPDLVGDGHHFV